MKKHSTLFAIFTYFIIVFLVIGINLMCYNPASKLKDNAIVIEETYENKISEIEKNENNQKIMDIYSEYNLGVQEQYKSFCRIFTNMIVSLLVFISLALVIVGLAIRVNTNRNKSVYNAIIFAGITCILYLIWFSINIANSFELLF